jgi:MtrB/PioB family decaheme-associated outer membrane protein
LPSNFDYIVAAHRDPAGTGTQALTAVQLSSFHNENVYTGRKNTGLKAGYQFDRQWSMRVDFNRLDQTGAKLMAASYDGTGGGGGENSATFMNPTNYQTDTYKLALNWVGDKAHLTGSYFASSFKDGYDSVSFSNPFVEAVPDPITSFPTNTYATPPSNDFHQMKLSGDYELSASTQLAGGLSYGRNTQNVSFINDPLLSSPLPAASLNGLVITTHADLKVTNQTTDALVLSAGVTYNQRDNQTPSYVYESFNSVAGDPWGAAVNTPVSNQSTKLELAGNYRIDKKQSVYLNYDFDKTKQWCNNALANNFQSTALADVDNPNSPFPQWYNTSACVQSPDSTENRLAASYKLKASDDVHLNLGYVYSNRKTTINSSYYNPMQTSSEGVPNLGFISYFNASRTEQLVKGGVNWQANEQLNVGVNGRYTKDDYDVTLGVKQGYAWTLNLDASYTYSRELSVSGYMGMQHSQRDLLASSQNAPLAASTDLWANQLKDDNSTIGVNVKNNGLMGGKLTVTGDLSYSLGKTGYTTQVLYDDPLCTTYGITCGALPDIKNEMLRFKLRGTYQLDKASQVALTYAYKKLTSNDYYYSAYLTGSTDVTVLPTNQQAPNHTVNVLGVSYIYSFR